MAAPEPSMDMEIGNRRVPVLIPLYFYANDQATDDGAR